MEQGNSDANRGRDPMPLSSAVQEVTPLEDGGWISVIKSQSEKNDEAQGDYELFGGNGAVGNQRRQTDLRRMGIR